MILLRPAGGECSGSAWVLLYLVKIFDSLFLVVVLGTLCAELSSATGLPKYAESIIVSYRCGYCVCFEHLDRFGSIKKTKALCPREWRVLTLGEHLGPSITTKSSLRKITQASNVLGPGSGGNKVERPPFGSAKCQGMEQVLGTDGGVRGVRLQRL
jgi:hypothetical protein